MNRLQNNRMEFVFCDDGIVIITKKTIELKSCIGRRLVSKEKIISIEDSCVCLESADRSGTNGTEICPSISISENELVNG